MTTIREHMTAAGVTMSAGGDVRSAGQKRGEWSLVGASGPVELRVALPDGSTVIDGDVMATVEYRPAGPAKTMNAHIVCNGEVFAVIGSSVADVASIAHMTIVAG